jgi:hypothetical protein
MKASKSQESKCLFVNSQNVISLCWIVFMRITPILNYVASILMKLLRRQNTLILLVWIELLFMTDLTYAATYSINSMINLPTGDVVNCWIDGFAYGHYKHNFNNRYYYQCAYHYQSYEVTYESTIVYSSLGFKRGDKEIFVRVNDVEDPSWYSFYGSWSLRSFPIEFNENDKITARFYKTSCSACSGTGIYLSWDEELYANNTKHSVIRFGYDVSVNTNIDIITIRPGVKYTNFELSGQGGDGVGVYRIRFYDKETQLTLFELWNANDGYTNNDNLFFDSSTGSSLLFDMEIL